MDETIKTMIDALEKYNAGFISVKMGKYTFIITNDEEGAEYLKNAWDEYVEKVIEELEEARKYGNDNTPWLNEILDNAIQTIRELQSNICKYWNEEHKECSMGDTIVVEDWCEWKLDFKKEYYNANDDFGRGIKREVFEDIFFDEDMYCPYCGRKIKVVE